MSFSSSLAKILAHVVEEQNMCQRDIRPQYSYVKCKQGGILMCTPLSGTPD